MYELSRLMASYHLQCVYLKYGEKSHKTSVYDMIWQRIDTDWHVNVTYLEISLHNLTLLYYNLFVCAVLFYLILGIYSQCWLSFFKLMSCVGKLTGWFVNVTYPQILQSSWSVCVILHSARFDYSQYDSRKRYPWVQEYLSCCDKW